MSFKELANTQKIFSELHNEISDLSDEANRYIKSYIQQNISIINNLIAISIEDIKKIKNTTSKEKIICAQARLINKIERELSLSNQHFLTELLGHKVDHDAWVEAHCDLATD